MTAKELRLSPPKIRDQQGCVLFEPGKFGDLVAVGGDPLADITELERVRFVTRDSQVVKHELTIPRI